MKTGPNRACDPLNKIVTLPNALSFFRLCLIPVIVWLYCVAQNFPMTGCILVLSGATDIVDGFIARRFHMISNLGKILDPVADKLTQTAVLFCLLTRFPLMLLPLALLVLKELFMAVTGLMIIRRTSRVLGAEWHGKAATSLLYGTMILHVVWYDIPTAVSTLSIFVCVVMMAVSMVLYGLRNTHALQENG